MFPLLGRLFTRRSSPAAFRRHPGWAWAAVEAGLDAVGLVDADGVVRAWQSPGGLGGPAEAALDHPFDLLAHPDDRPLVRDRLADGFGQPGRAAVVCCRLRHADGGWLPAEVRVQNRLADPAVRAVVLTARRQADGELRPPAAADRMARGIAHDLNNLLTAAHGSARTALIELPAGSPAAGWVGEAVKATERAAALTRKLMAGRRPADSPRPLDLNAVVRGMADVFRRVLGERIALALDLTDDPHPVAGDVGELERLLLNLVANARDAMPAGGSLRVATRNAGPEAIELTVTDTGEGMPAEVREHIFEPFFTTKPADQGSGLGLAVVAGVVAEHGGQVTVESDPGAGTTFRVRLPRSAARPAADTVADGPVLPVRAPGGRPVVLLAEDDDGVRAVTAHTLRAAGYEVLACGTAEEAAAVARQHPGRVDVLVTDVMLPGLGGRELADEVTAVRPQAAVLFVSGYAAEALDVGDRPLLEKPYTLAALTRAVRAALVRPAAAG